jgi:hypothetical protein
MRLGLRASNEALHVLDAGQHGFEGRDNRGACSPVYAASWTKV